MTATQVNLTERGENVVSFKKKVFPSDPFQIS